MMFEMIYILIVTWIEAFLLHELCHLLEAYRQGANSLAIRVWIWKFIPSFQAVADDIKNEFLFALSGGLYSGLILLLETIIAIATGASVFILPLTVVTITNLIYSIYEAKYLYKIPMDVYMKWHYLIYAIGIVLAVVLYKIILQM